MSRHEIDVEQLTRNVVAPVADEQDRRAEVSLRPSTLAEFVGQRELVRHLEIVLGSARARNQTADTCCSRAPQDSARRHSPASWRVRWVPVFASRRVQFFHALVISRLC